MEKFDGFPAGELRFTAVPDLFFARLLPQIDNLIELKVILHFIWVHYRQTRQAIAFNELLADETLVASLALLTDDVKSALQAGLNSAVQRGVLLHARLNNETGSHDLYYLNSERGRQAHQKLQTGELGVVAISPSEVAPPTKRPNIFELYEDNISLISPIIADELKDAEATYPQEWIEEAFKIAVENNVRKWSYVRAILERMAASGPGDPHKQEKTDKTWYSPEENDLIQR